MTNSACVQQVLDRLSGVSKSGNGWKACCPAHDDKHPSLVIAEADSGKVLIHCHAGCELTAIVEAVGLKMRDLSPSKRRKKCVPLDEPVGCTLAQYAKAKKLPEKFLRSLGLGDLTYQSKPAVRIPYHAADGTEVSIQFRLALSGDNRIRWKAGNKPTLYGIDRLTKSSTDYIVIVEGASDCHTLWHHGIPALGLPSASKWDEERWASYFKSFSIIYVVIEPDNGGECVKKWLAKSSIRDRVRLVSLSPHKDPSDLHIADSEKFKKCWQEALDDAVPWGELTNREEQHRTQRAFGQCKRLAKSPNILTEFAKAIKSRGVVGEERAAKLLFLAIVSRLLDRPVSVAVKGPSSGGKSFVTEQTLAFFPAESFYALTSGSEKSLAYSDEPLEHRMLVVFEMAGLSSEFGSYLLRSLLSEGRLCYETVEKIDGKLRGRKIERAGPTGLIVTTTSHEVDFELETRLLTVNIQDDSEQTKAILAAMTARNGPLKPLDDWHALQTWLASAEHRVKIPFAPQLAELMPPVAVRLRRDFGQVLSLIEAHAILHQATRKRDRTGCVVATLDDYDEVRQLVGELIAEGVHAGVPKDIRETVEVVRKLAASRSEVSVNDVAEQLKLHESNASRRITKAIRRGFLTNLESRMGRPHRIVLGNETLPDKDESILPKPSTVARLHAKAKGKRPPRRSARF